VARKRKPSYEAVQCPACGFIGESDWFDCMGADYGNVFCPECGKEFELCYLNDSVENAEPRQRELPLTGAANPSAENAATSKK